MLVKVPLNPNVFTTVMIPLLVVLVLLFKLKLSSAIIVPLLIIVPPELNELVILAVPQFWKVPLKFKLPKIAADKI